MESAKLPSLYLLGLTTGMVLLCVPCLPFAARAVLLRGAASVKFPVHLMQKDGNFSSIEVEVTPDTAAEDLRRFCQLHVLNRGVQDLESCAARLQPVADGFLRHAAVTFSPPRHVYDVLFHVDVHLDEPGSIIYRIPLREPIAFRKQLEGWLDQILTDHELATLTEEAGARLALARREVRDLMVAWSVIVAVVLVLRGLLYISTAAFPQTRDRQELSSSGTGSTGLAQGHGHVILRFVMLVVIAWGHIMFKIGHPMGHTIQPLLNVLSAVISFMTGCSAAASLFTESKACSLTSSVAFLCRRVGRTWPALISHAILTTYIVCPGLSDAGFGEYLRRGSTWGYMFSCIVAMPASKALLPSSYTTYELPLEGAHAQNHALWTLPYQYRCWVQLAVVQWFIGCSQAWPRRRCVGTASAVIGVVLAWISLPSMVPGSGWSAVRSEGMFFSAMFWLGAASWLQTSVKIRTVSGKVCLWVGCVCLLGSGWSKWLPYSAVPHPWWAVPLAILIAWRAARSITAVVEKSHRTVTWARMLSSITFSFYLNFEPIGYLMSKVMAPPAREALGFLVHPLYLVNLFAVQVAWTVILSAMSWWVCERHFWRPRTTGGVAVTERESTGVQTMDGGGRGGPEGCGQHQKVQ